MARGSGEGAAAVDHQRGEEPRGGLAVAARAHRCGGPLPVHDRLIPRDRCPPEKDCHVVWAFCLKIAVVVKTVLGSHFGW